MSESALPSDPVPPAAVARDRLRLPNDLMVCFRTVTDGDEPEILAFLSRLSDQSRRFRFFCAAIDLRAEVHREMTGNDDDHHGLLARLAGGRVVGHAIYIRLPGKSRAEVAVEVADDLHHLGLATQLMIRLAEHAEARGITGFFAEVLPENRDMLAVFADAFDTTSVTGLDAIEIEFATSGWRTANTHLESARSR
jgi:GNAT superfamily N-acetyltransferase